MSSKNLLIVILLILLVPLPIIEVLKYIYNEIATDTSWWKVGTICNPSKEFNDDTHVKIIMIFVSFIIVIPIGAAIIEWYYYNKDKEKQI